MIQPVILAAGKGTRMRSERPKTLFEIEGKPMLGHILDTVAQVPSCLPPLVIVGHGKDEVISYVGARATCIEQTDITGTASAVRAALPHIPQEASGVLVLYGDQPFIKKESIQKLVDAHEKNRPTIVQSVFVAPHFADEYAVFAAFGRIVRTPEGDVARIVESKNATPAEQAITEVNPGTCLIERAWLTHALSTIQKNAQTGEYYLTDSIGLAREEGLSIVTVEVTLGDALGINSPEDATRAQSLIHL